RLRMFYGYGVIQPLPAFPTRRSSDLKRRVDSGRTAVLHGAGPEGGTADGSDCFRGSQRHQCKSVDGGEEQQRRLAADFFHFQRRSEEHTSELQSRFDLVCRLLLEKKH